MLLNEPNLIGCYILLSSFFWLCKKNTAAQYCQTAFFIDFNLHRPCSFHEFLICILLWLACTFSTPTGWRPHQENTNKCDQIQRTKMHIFFHPATDPFPPERPQNITAENQTVSADGRVSVLLRWDPPREGDLQLRHYKVTWSGPSGKESGRVADGVRLPLCSSCHILLRSQTLLCVWLRTPNIFFCPTFTASRQEVFFFALNISFVSGKCVFGGKKRGRAVVPKPNEVLWGSLAFLSC